MLDVARLAQVSHQTVSRYFQFAGGLKPVTRERIEAAVRELNYRPNLVARSMRTRKTGRLAVFVPTLAFNPSRMLAGATATAHAAGFVVDVIALEGGAEQRTHRILELADSGQVEGILSFAPVLAEKESEFARGTTVAVSADFDDEMRGIGELADGSPVRQLVERLHHLGYVRFAHVTGDLQFASARGRRQMFLDTLGELGLEPVLIHEGDWSGESGMAAVARLDDSDLPVAVIAANDLVASGVYRAAIERGWRIPDDVAITGWDNNPIGRFMSPSLTTVEVDLESLGSNAMSRLIAALRDEPQMAPAEPLSRVIWRESTAPRGLSG